MYLKILAAGFMIFCLLMFLHVVVWRWRRPKVGIAALAIFFFGVPMLVALFVPILSWLGQWHDIVRISHASIGELAAIALLYFALAGAYVLTYPAAQASSPSLAILLKVGDSMPSGTNFEDLLTDFEGQSVVAPRIRDLVTSKLAKETNGELTLTLGGRVLARSFGFLRRALALPTGRG